MVVADARPEKDDEKSKDKRYVHFVLDVDNGLLVGLLVGKDTPGASATLMGIAKEFDVAPDAQKRFEAVADQVPEPPSGGPLQLPIGELALLEKFEVGPGMETVVRDGRGRIRAVKRTFVLERPATFALPKLVAVAASCGTLDGVDDDARALMANPYLEPESREDVRILATGDTTFASRPGRWVQFVDGVAENRMHGSYWYAEGDGHYLTARLWQNVKKAEVRDYEALMPGLPGRCELASELQGLVR
jgi:hypothetical protein